MGKIDPISVAFPEDIVARMQAAVDDGEYATTGEIIREAVRDWAERQVRRQDALERLRAEIAKGLEGPFVDGPTALEELREFVAAKAREYSSQS